MSMMNRDLSNFIDLGLGYNPSLPSVVDFNPRWKRIFSDEAYLIFDSLRIENLKLFHIGSTSIDGLCAKPIIDIMGSVSDFSELDQKTEIMEQLGFDAKGEFGIPNRRFFVLCDPKSNLRFIHLHVFLDNSSEVTRHLQFRDFLRKEKHLANKYGQLKKEIMNDLSRKNKYQEEKSQLVSEIEEMAIRKDQPQKTLIINGAAKGGHNTESFIKEIYNLPEVKLIDLNALNFPTFEYGKNSDDSFIFLIKEIAVHELIILGVPVYWYSMPSSIKALLDRFSNLMNGPYKELGENLNGKKLIVCSTGYEEKLPLGFEVPFICTSIYFGMDYLGIKYRSVKR